MDRLVAPEYFSTWKSLLEVDLGAAFAEIKKITLSRYSFTHFTSVSVISSSKIEAEQMEVEHYVMYKMLDVEYPSALTEKPDDLYEAYLFAKNNRLTKANSHKAHRLVTAHLSAELERGGLRNAGRVLMKYKAGETQCETEDQLVADMDYEKFWNELDGLLSRELTVDETFYYAAFIHLVFVNIHPFVDGNCRMARLLEKWFLKEKLGERAWYIPSEKYYYKHIDSYYRNLSKLGIFYEKLDYARSIPFLLMLPQALIVKP
jgi:Uncharacterized conserved protein